jgi:Cu-processing system ATP-binding protein
MMSPESPVVNTLELKGLCKTYGSQTVVDKVDLSVATGESLAIIGHNGAGKTTLMKLILGLTRASAGNIRLGPGSSTTKQLQNTGESIGFLPEVVSFPTSLSGRHLLRFYARLKKESDRNCDELLELVGLTAAADQKIGTYSKGMRQRLGLAQALLGDPSLLLLDEPTSGLDPFLRGHFYEIISARQATGTSVLISSHALTEIEARTDRIAIMKNGRLLVQGSLAQLRSEAALPVRILVKHHPTLRDKLLETLQTTVPYEALGRDQLQFACREEQKLPLLHQLTGQQEAVLDVIVRPPRLDDLYTHFVNGSDA